MALVKFDCTLHKRLPRYSQCIVCGSKNDFGLKTWFFTDFEAVYNTCVLDEHYIGYPNRIHGGVISAIVDEAMGWSATIKTHLFYYTVELCVRYKNMARPYICLYTTAKLLETKNKIAITYATIYDEYNQIIANAKGKYYPLTPQEQHDIENLLSDS